MRPDEKKKKGRREHISISEADSRRLFVYNEGIAGLPLPLTKYVKVAQDKKEQVSSVPHPCLREICWQETVRKEHHVFLLKEIHRYFTRHI